MNVELVSVNTDDGVRLEGALRQPGANNAELGIDLVICHHGVGSNFYVPSFFDRVGDALLEQGTAVLRVNNRGHDQAYLQGQRRLGAAYEIIDDARFDWSAWLDFAAARGFSRVGVWGHSLGAVKTVYVLSVAHDARVVCAVASSPPRFSHAAYQAAPNHERFTADIESAQALVDRGEQYALLEALVPQARPFSVQTYLDKYGADARYDYFLHLPNVQVPLLLTLGSLEVQDVSFAPLAADGPTMQTRWPRIDYRLIGGADHMYTNHTDQLWQAVRGWLERVAASRPRVS